MLLKICHQKFEENIKITLFYSGNSKKLKNSGWQKMTDLRKQGSPQFLEKDNKTSVLMKENKFVSNMLAGELKQPQTITIILPNLIHQSKKRDLHR